MGYTHYWKYTDNELYDRSEVSTLIQEGAQKVIELASKNGILLDVLPGEKHLEGAAPASLVFLNGVEKEAHETFAFPGSEGFNFCKTAFKPYDIVVTAILILAKYYAPRAFVVSSDGTLDDWRAGWQLASNATGIDIAVPNFPESASFNC